MATVNTTAASVNLNGALHKSKSTENSRLIVALSAIGKDATSVGDWDLVEAYSANGFSWIKKQGLNGTIWALIALDSNNYETSDETIRQQCVDAILAAAEKGVFSGTGVGQMLGVCNDPRVTKVGRILRMTKLDELPQLFNILKGEMSFIGPRPEVLLYTTQYTPEQECILWVRPGITDPSSIKLISLDKAVGHDDPEGTYEREILGEKNRMRVEYATTQCFTGDFKIFFATFGALFRKLFVPEPADDASQAANQGGQQ